MTQITLEINSELSAEEIKKYREILLALISCGGLSGVKSGQTIIHFDKDGNFMGIQFSYWPWRRRKILL